MSFIDEIWYKKLNLKNSLVIILLLPFTGLFKFITCIRRYFYKKGIFKSYKTKVPLIVVGGISVGGTGKTPLSIALIEKLSNEGFKVGLLSRGYKGQSDVYPYVVLDTSDIKKSGDEPYLIKLEVGNKAIVCVDPNRERGAKYLESLGCDVIVLDDGLQHYSLNRDLEIIVIDGKRGLGNGFLMPSGPLREGIWHLNKAQFLVTNGICDDKRLDLVNKKPYQMYLKPQKAISIKSFVNNSLNRDYLGSNSKVIALAGIGNPKRFYDTLNLCGYDVVSCIDVGDHGLVNIDILFEKSKDFPIVMTAKDAVKYKDYNLDNVFVLDVKAQLNDEFFELLINKITEKYQ